MRLLTIIPALVLAGCATQWAKPGGTQEEFYSDRYQCQQEAAANYPAVPTQQMISPGYQAPQQQTTNTNCTNMGGGMVQCQSTQTGVNASMYNRPATYATVDVNQDARFYAVRSCLLARGYRPGR